jgi:predicted DNA binding protein
MVVYAEIAVPASGFRIGRAFGEFPDVVVEMDRIVPTVSAVIPFIWVEGAPAGEVVRATREHEAAEEITALHEEDGRTLYRVVWNRTFRDTVVSIAESDLAMLSGVGTAEEWRFQFRSETKAPLSAFVAELRDENVPATVVRLTDDPPSPDGERARLTAAQFEALELAYREGYFEEPRATSLEALAVELGITRQAFGGRLRRALATLAARELGAPTE